MSAQPRAFTVRHVQLLRALLAAIAALMITFSADHSAEVGLSVFSGFAIATSLVLYAGPWLVLARGRRWSYVLLATISLIAGLVAGVPALRSDDVFFVLVIVWAAASAVVEIIAGLRGRRDDNATARDSLLIGSLSALLAIALLLIPAGFASEYSVGEQSGVLTGIILGVGVFGGYAAIVAVFLGIAGFTPSRTDAPASSTDTVTEGAA